jgi:hypothetical protein
MMIIWTRRRRVPLARRIVRSLLIVGAAAGAAAGVDILRRKLGIGMPRVEVDSEGRRARVSVSLRRSRAGGRRRRSVSASRS